MRALIWVMIGGAVGSGARYLVAQGAARYPAIQLPLGTLAVNLVGSFLLMLLLERFRAHPADPALQLALTSGVMGGFTTYSTFNAELLRFLDTGAHRLAALYLTLTVLGCLAGAFAGRTLARTLLV